jgi:tetratricopeptide (TPR) repeat protein
MAKRKKKSGGGAFGGGAKPAPRGLRWMHDFGGPRLDSEPAQRTNDQSIKLIQKAMMSQGIQTPEELEKFLNERMVGKPLDELAAEFEGDEPKNDFERAESLMDGLDEDASPAEIRRTAKQALKFSPYCIAAWLALGRLEEDPAVALELCNQGIEHGRVRFDALIESLEEGQGIWGWIEARDFMRLMHERAMRLEELGDFEEAIEAYQEMLSLNPGDNQGVRGDTLRLLMVFRRLDEARKLVESFPNDSTVEMAYGRALLSIVETVERTGFQMPAKGSPGEPSSPSALAKCLGPEFNDSIKLLKRAVKANPFVPLMMREPQIMGIEIADMVLFGGPLEAAVYTQKWAAIWYAAGLPMVMMLAQYPTNPDRLVKSRALAEELAEVLAQTDELDDIPWWEKFDHPDN